ncbi:hypothetical protein [Pseudotamlana carrageenivorans]|uniref:Uncharacterized protein n=1 Tax=Pseudotamlana carrageenivorans TaxID=2069432 RepID=A0A2I7SEQ1_9FLAO|nr:hypothetical protein [Tamlana carrageenivorans]AUS04381.1 hypothetical protein C1A40_02340 [Tamlana carrageenivorans]
MANLEIKTPKKSQFINAGASTVGAVVGYQGYDMLAQNLPISKEMNVGISAASLLAQTAIRGKGVGYVAVQALLLGVTLCSGITALADYGLINQPVARPVEVNEDIEIIETAEALNALHGDSPVEYIQDAVILDDSIDLS